MLGIARSHLGPEIVASAHASGYVCLYHYGCTTAVAQVNDTDLHQEFSRLYMELEQTAFNNQQLFDPGNISRTLQQVINDAASAWRICDHTKGVRGHKLTGLSNSLDDSEDHLISREAAIFWAGFDLPSARLRAIEEVDELIASGTIRTFGEWQQVVKHPVDPGAQALEGMEFEGELEAGECCWLTEEEKARVATEEVELLRKQEA